MNGRGRDQFIDFFGTEYFREMLPEFGGIDEFHDTFGKDRLQHEIAEKHLERNKVSGHRCGRVLMIMKILQVSREQFEIDLLQACRTVLAVPGIKADQVTAIGEDGVFG